MARELLPESLLRQRQRGSRENVDVPRRVPLRDPERQRWRFTGRSRLECGRIQRGHVLLTIAEPALPGRVIIAEEETVYETVHVAEGKCNDYDGWYGCQCMDLVLFWEQYLGLSLLQADSALHSWNLNPDPSQYQKIVNGPTNVPAASIRTGSTATARQGPHAVRVDHSYNAVLGWFHPIIAAPPPPSPAHVTVVPLDGYHHFGG